MVQRMPGQPPVVLVVEDEEMVRENAAEMLRSDGYEVIDAADAGAALKVMETRPDVTVLFTDMNMPGRLDGLELAREVHDRWPNVLLLITSGREVLRDAEIPDHGHFLSKPYRLAALSGQVGELLANHQEPEPPKP
jgi:CheY-like chemotaxis protein